MQNRLLALHIRTYNLITPTDTTYLFRSLLTLPIRREDPSIFRLFYLLRIK